MTDAKRVFELAMGLMDEISETTGSADSADTGEYRNRALLILNILRGELYPYSENFRERAGEHRPVCPEISSFDSPIGLDDHICQSLLPYGLAAHLLIDENPAAAGFFQQRYEEGKAMLGRGMQPCSEDIRDLYGGIEYGGFGRW